MAKSKEELEKEIDRLLEQNKMTSSSSIPYSDNADRFYDSIKAKNKQELDNQTRLVELQAQASRLKGNTESFAQYQKTVGQVDTLQARISLDEVYRDERARTSFTEATKKAFSTEAIASDASKFGRSAGQGEVHQLARQYTTSQLRQRLGEASVGVTQWGEHAQSIASEYSGAPDQKKEYMRMMSYRQQDIGRMSLLDQAMRAQKRMGTDIGSREESLERFRGGFERDRMSHDISRDIATGKTGSINQEMKKLEEAAAKVTKALEAMSKTTDRSDENLEKLATSAEEARSEYERQKETVGQMRSGGGGGGRSGRAISWMGGIGASLSVAGHVGEGIFVNNEMGITSNRIAQVNLANSRNNDIQAAGQGDMAAYRRVVTDQYNKSVLEGLDMRNTSRVTTGLGVAGTLATGAAGAWAGAKLGAAGGAMMGGVGAIPGAIFGGILGGGAGITAGTIGTHSALNDIQADQVMLARTQQMNDLSNAVNAIGDQGNQMGMDYRMGSLYASRGIGSTSLTQQASQSGASIMPSTLRSGRNQTIRLMEQDSTIQALRGLSGEERNSLLSYGVGVMGARMGGQRGIDMMATGQNLAQAGYTRNAEQFIGMSSRLTGASGDENVMMRGLKVAVSEGMQGANVFQSLSEAIGALGNNVAGLGGKLSEGFAARFAGAAGAISSRGYSNEQAIAMAKGGVETANSIMTDRSLSAANIIRSDYLRKNIGTPQNFSEMLSFEGLQKMSLQDFDASKSYQDRIKSSTPGSSERAGLEKEYKEFQISKGILGRSDKDIEAARIASFDAVIDSKVLMANPAAASRLKEAFRNNKLSDKDRSDLAGLGILDASTVMGRSTDAKGSLNLNPTGEGGTGERTIEFMKDITDKQLKQGLTGMNPQEMEKNFKVISDSYDPRKYSADAKKTAETGEVPTKQFAETFENLKTLYDGMSQTLISLNKNIEAMGKANSSASAVFDGSTTKFSKAVDKMVGEKSIQANVNSNMKTK
jgi:hypothetical protein